MLSEKVYAAVAMGPVRILSLLAAGLLSIATAAAAGAAPIGAAVPSSATATLVYPTSVRLLNNLNFGYLTVAGAGTAVVSPADVITTTGGVVSIGGNPYSALFEAVAPIKTVVHIRAPKGSILVTRVGGTETMVVDNFTVSGDKKNVVAKELFTFSVGARLNVNANQAEGVYVGTFTVDIQYN
jgi:hypothetical protein